MNSISPPQRFPCGKRKRSPKTIEQIAEAERISREAEMQTVLAQPHRRGNRSQLAECPLGRFCAAHKLHRALYDAGEAYGALKRKWLAAYDAPLPDKLGGSGRDIDMEDVRKWGELIDEWEAEMMKAGTYLGRLSVKSLIFDRPEPTVKIHPALAIRALTALAIHQGRIDAPR